MQPLNSRSIDSQLAMQLCHSWDVGRLEELLQELVGKRKPWIRGISQELWQEFSALTRPSYNLLFKFLKKNSVYRKSKRFIKKIVKTVPHTMVPTPVSKRSSLPEIVTERSLAEVLDVPIQKLEWLTKRRRKSRNYTLRQVPKRGPGFRLLEIPKSDLKAVQRRVQSEILDRIPVHPLAKGFCRGSNIQEYVRSHVANEMILKLDLQDFFTTIGEHRIVKLIWNLGYPPFVVSRLVNLCTTFCNNEELESLFPDVDCRNKNRHLLTLPHLPQGAPTSPTLSNLVAYRLDARLAGFAANRGMSYTRYADDLLFSSSRGSSCQMRGNYHFIASIILEEKFQLNFRKTRILGGGQSQRVAGMVINQKINFPRREYENLKAIIHNASQFGFQAANRENRPYFKEFLRGKIQFLIDCNPEKGHKLLAKFQSVQERNGSKSES